MFKILRFTILLINIAAVLSAVAQKASFDSLKKVIKNAKHDSVRIKTYLVLGEQIYLDQPDSAVALWQKAKIMADKRLNSLSPNIMEYKIYRNLLSGALNDIGYYYKTKGNLTIALDYWEKSLIIQKEDGDKKGMANSMNNIGNYYYAKGDIIKSLDYFEKSLKIQEEIGYKRGVASSLCNIANIYDTQGDFKSALDHYMKSLILREDIGDKKGMAESLNNIGYIYRSQGDIPKALDYYRKSMKLQEEINDIEGIATSLNNVGRIYDMYGDPEVTSSRDNARKAGTNKALENFSKSLELREKIGDKNGIAYTYNNIANIYLKQKNYVKSLDFCLKSMQVSKELGFPNHIKNAAHALSKAYKATGKFQLALENYELFIQMRDSLNNESNRKASIKSQLKYEYEKQAAADSVSHAKESEVKNAELAKQSAEIKAKKNQQYALFGGLGLVMIFAGFMFNRFKVTQKQKEIIENQKEVVEEQKKLVEEKQKEVLDSIHYARKIQMAQIPNNLQVELSINRCIKK